MLLKGLDTDSEIITSKELVSSELSRTYREVKEVGNGSYG